MAVGRARRHADLREALRGEQPVKLIEQPIKLICCWCDPPHVMRDGIEPASHGACPRGIELFESGASA